MLQIERRATRRHYQHHSGPPSNGGGAADTCATPDAEVRPGKPPIERDFEDGRDYYAFEGRQPPAAPADRVKVAFGFELAMIIRFYLDPATGQPHVLNHGVEEMEVFDVLEAPGEDRAGRDGSRVATGQTAAGRYLA